MPPAPAPHAACVAHARRRSRGAYPPDRPATTGRSTEIDEQTTLGHTYVRSLMRSQLRAALTVFAVLALLVGPLPLVFAALPDAPRLDWAVLGFCLLPAAGAARPLVRTARRAQRAGLRPAGRRTAEPCTDE